MNERERLKDYIKQIITDVLPRDTVFENGHLEVAKTGLTNLNGSNMTRFNIEGLTDNEKHSSTTRYGIPIDSDNTHVLWPHYIRIYDLTVQKEKLSRIKLNSILEANPTPVATYGVSFQDIGSTLIGSAVIDLNHLQTAEGRPVKAERLDRILKRANFPETTPGFPDITSFEDVQAFFNNEYIAKTLSPLAIIQIALLSYFIPNATGQTDSNSRNIIVLDNNIAVGIDGEGNTYLADELNERSGSKKVPKGIFKPNEPLETFLKNISSKDSSIDWLLFAGLTLISEQFTSRSNIDDSISNRGYKRNIGRYIKQEEEKERQRQERSSLSMFYGNAYNSNKNYEFSYINTAETLGSLGYADFSEKTIERAKRYNDNVKNALTAFFNKCDTFPFENTITNLKLAEKLFPILYNNDGVAVNKDGEPLQFD